MRRVFLGGPKIKFLGFPASPTPLHWLSGGCQCDPSPLPWSPGDAVAWLLESSLVLGQPHPVPCPEAILPHPRLDLGKD